MTGERRDTHSRGRRAEQAAVTWLEGQGYRILERNVRQRGGGEIDLVARDGDTLCFVEVKARGTATFGSPLLAVGIDKQRRLSRAAALYIARHDLHRAPCRFDVLALEKESGAWRYTLVRDAFPYRGNG